MRKIGPDLLVAVGLGLIIWVLGTVDWRLAAVAAGLILIVVGSRL